MNEDNFVNYVICSKYKSCPVRRGFVCISSHMIRTLIACDLARED